jgi:hypothetical protein
LLLSNTPFTYKDKVVDEESKVPTTLYVELEFGAKEEVQEAK